MSDEEFPPKKAPKKGRKKKAESEEDDFFPGERKKKAAPKPKASLLVVCDLRGTPVKDFLTGDLCHFSWPHVYWVSIFPLLQKKKNIDSDESDFAMNASDDNDNFPSLASRAMARRGGTAPKYNFDSDSESDDMF